MGKPRKFSKYARKAQQLPTTRIGLKSTEAWFYSCRGSIELVVFPYPSGPSAMYRFRLRDMRKIVEDLT